jgi:hypothetical protein
MARTWSFFKYAGVSMNTNTRLTQICVDCNKRARAVASRSLVIALLPICLSLVATAHADELDATLLVWLKTIDTNGDQALSRDELNARLSKLPANADGERAAQSLQMFLRGFSVIDRNRDGVLSASEISEGINTRFTNADRDRNGVLTQSEASNGMPMVAKNFGAIDFDSRGAVSVQQVRAYLAQTMRQAAAQAATR